MRVVLWLAVVLLWGAVEVVADERSGSSQGTVVASSNVNGSDLPICAEGCPIVSGNASGIAMCEAMCIAEPYVTVCGGGG